VNYSLLSLDFRMHGNSVAPRPGFNIQDLCSDILRLSDHLGIERFHVFGYSLGGYAALCLEKIRPGRVRSLMMHGTKFYWDAASADSFARRLDPDFIERRQAKWAEQLRSLHDGQGPGHWKRLCVAAADFVRTLPGTFSDADIAAVHFPVQVSLGDRDDLVPLAEAASLARALPHGSLSVLPDTRHPIGACDPAILASQIDAFIRRAREGGE
jgi:pimeloyl-ACP methyl ester carboxylesterase